MNEILTERPNLFEPNVYISICVSINGRVSAKKLSEAIEKAYEANESTMSRVVLENGTAYYEKLKESGCSIEITDKDWLEIIKENEKKPFNIKDGELIRAFVIMANESAKLFIMAHHLVGDGKSVIYFVKDVMEALSGRKLQYKPLTMLDRKNVLRTDLTLQAKLYAGFCRKKWKSHCFKWEDYYHIHNSYWSKRTSCIQYRTLSASKSAEIKEKAKHAGCSVNSYIVTAFLKADNSNCEAGIPLSIREKGNESMTNLTSGIAIVHHYNDKISFDENAVQVHKKIYKTIKKRRMFVLQFLASLPTTLIDAVLMNTHGCFDNPFMVKTTEIMGYTENTKRDMGITNLTVLDIPTEYKVAGNDNIVIENVIFVPPAISYSHNIIGVSTVNGRMTISYHRMEGNPHEYAEFFEKGIKNLT